MGKMKLTVGTRGSRLSLIQTDLVNQKLKQSYPNLEIETKIIRTTGDKMLNKSLLEIKRRGIFEKEIDEAIVQGEIDFAVHSMKDVPIEQHSKTVVVAIPEREAPHDVLVSRENSKLLDLPSGSVVGTGSPRREAQVHHARPDLKVEHIRGNVDTRTRKLELGSYDAIITAEAGLHRLNMSELITERLSLEDFTPCPGQGALALVARRDRDDVIEILKTINNIPSMAEVFSERAFAESIGGGCKVPIGAVARTKGNALSLYGAILSPDGRTELHTNRTGYVDAPEELGIEAAVEIRRLGADRIIREWRDVYG